MRDDRTMICNPRLWPGETLCLKKRPQLGEKTGVMGYSDFGIITTNSAPLVIYGYDGGLRAIYESVDALLAAGWLVD